MKGRNIQISNNGEYLLVAEFEDNIAAFEVSSGKKLGEYSTKYSGGRLMYISNSGSLVYSSEIGTIEHAYSDPEHIIIDVTGKVFEVGKDSCVPSALR